MKCKSKKYSILLLKLKKTTFFEGANGKMVLP